MKVIDYVKKFHELGFPRNKWVAETKNWLELIKEEIARETMDAEVVRSIQITGNSVKFTFCDFSVCIEFAICSNKGGGFVKWFLERCHDEAGKIHRVLILKHKFNGDGIETHTFENRNLYFHDSLALFLEKADQIEFDENTV